MTAGRVAMPQKSPYAATILVVDDESDIRDFLCDRLQSIGFDVIKAPDGPTGLDILQIVRIDGVLLDVEMPHLDGIAVLRAVRTRHPRLPVVMMSATGSAERLRAALEEGAKEYILKPFDNDLLRELCLRVFLGRTAGS
jgi:DNA-binding response OmpR family regulator